MKSIKSFLMSIIIFKPFFKKIRSIFKSIFLGIFQILIIILSPFLIPIMKLMATTGAGTNICLKYGFLPVPVHFYQPIPDIPELERRNAWDKISNIRGIKFEPENNINFIKQLAQTYADECNWPNEPTRNVMQFYLHNSGFSYGCATPLHCIIRHYKPKRIVEIGSGNSSKVIAAAIELNILDNHQTNYTIIDPYSNLDQNIFPKGTNILRQPVELMCTSSKDLSGKLFADKGYISQDLFAKLFQEDVQLVTGIRKNMQNRLMPWADKLLLRKRAIIETINDQLKNISQIEQSRHRSFVNFFVNLIAGLVAYCLQPKKPSLHIHHALPATFH